MPLVNLTRKASFCAAHRLHSTALTDDENKEIFGKCNNPNGHGHNYILEVTVQGEIDPKTGMMMNIVDLKRVIEETVVQAVDHKHLNLDVPAFAQVNPTAENMVVVFWKMLTKRLGTVRLHEIKLHETEKNTAVYRGE